MNHIFEHGVHDLNVVAAIITPRADNSVLKKCQSAGGTFMFGIDERSILWEQDIAFPRWAWVYRDVTRSFSDFLERLKQAAKQDGYNIEFVMMYGCEIATPEDPPTGAYDCEIIIMSDVARRASYQRSNSRIRNFRSCTKWKPVRVDNARLERLARLNAHRAMLRMQSKLLNGAGTTLDDGASRTEKSLIMLKLI